MENKDLAIKRNKRAVLLVRIAALLGFSIIMFIPTTYRNPFFGGLVFSYIISFPLGLLTAYLLGLITRFIFKFFIKNKSIYVAALIIFMIIAYGVGILVFMYPIRMFTGTL